MRYIDAINKYAQATSTGGGATGTGGGGYNPYDPMGLDNSAMVEDAAAKARVAQNKVRDLQAGLADARSQAAFDADPIKQRQFAKDMRAGGRVVRRRALRSQVGRALSTGLPAHTERAIGMMNDPRFRRPGVADAAHRMLSRFESASGANQPRSYAAQQMRKSLSSPIGTQVPHRDLSNVPHHVSDLSQPHATPGQQYAGPQLSTAQKTLGLLGGLQAAGIAGQRMKSRTHDPYAEANWKEDRGVGGKPAFGGGITGKAQSTRRGTIGPNIAKGVKDITYGNIKSLGEGVGQAAGKGYREGGSMGAFGETAKQLAMSPVRTNNPYDDARSAMGESNWKKMKKHSPSGTADPVRGTIGSLPKNDNTPWYKPR